MAYVTRLTMSILSTTRHHPKKRGRTRRATLRLRPRLAERFSRGLRPTDFHMSVVTHPKNANTQQHPRLIVLQSFSQRAPQSTAEANRRSQRVMFCGGERRAPHNARSELPPPIGVCNSTFYRRYCALVGSMGFDARSVTRLLQRCRRLDRSGHLDNERLRKAGERFGCSGQRGSNGTGTVVRTGRVDCRPGGTVVGRAPNKLSAVTAAIRRIPHDQRVTRTAQLIVHPQEGGTCGSDSDRIARVIDRDARDPCPAGRPKLV